MALLTIASESVSHSSTPFPLSLLAPYALMEEVAQAAIIIHCHRETVSVRALSMTCGPERQQVNVSQLGRPCWQNRELKPLEEVK